MRSEAIQSIKYGEIVIPSVYASALNVRKVEDTRFERTRKVEPITLEVKEGRGMLTYLIGFLFNTRGTISKEEKKDEEDSEPNYQSLDVRV